jgi:hypothetical protein
MSFVFNSLIQLFNEYIQVLKRWTKGERRFDESIPKIGQTRQLHLQGTPFLFHGISINVLRDRFALHMNGRKIMLPSIYGQQRGMD